MSEPSTSSAGGTPASSRTVLLVAHLGRPDALEAARQVVECLLAAGLNVCAPKEEAANLAIGEVISVEAEPDAVVGCELAVVLGGESVGPRFIDWNFVSSDRDLILEAQAAWSEQRFPTVPGESEFIPLPARPLPPGSAL